MRGGIHGLILPVRGTVKGFSARALGLLGTGWAIGYVPGCVIVPTFMGAVGPVRTFGVMRALGVDLSFILLVPEGQVMNLVLVAIFDVTIFAMYPIILARANDHAAPDTSIQVSGGLLMVCGPGSVAAPLVSGVTMTQFCRAACS